MTSTTTSSFHMTAGAQLAKIIDDAIVRSHLPQREVAHLVDVNVASISRWRRGHQRCPAYRIERLALALRLDEAETAVLQDLALRVEAEARGNKSAVRSLEVPRDITELQETVSRLEARVVKLESMLRLGN